MGFLPFYGYIYSLINGVNGIDLEILYPRLDHEIVGLVPHEEPGRVLDDPVFSLTVETIALFFVHGELCCLYQPVEFRIGTACPVPGWANAR